MRLPDIDKPLTLHEDGSLVKVPVRDWFVCFVPGIKKEWWNRYVHKKHNHVLALCPDKNGRWLLVESWWTRIVVATLPEKSARKYFHWGAQGDVLIIREAHPGESTQLRGWINCAAQIAALLGRKHLVWTPHHLYQKLSAEKAARRLDTRAFLAERTLTPERARLYSEACSMAREQPEKERLSWFEYLGLVKSDGMKN